MHAAVLHEFFVPTINESAPTCRYPLMPFHRAAYTGRCPSKAPVRLAAQPPVPRPLMIPRGIACAHIVGQSCSGNIAMQLALDSPQVVHTLALLEPALLVVPSHPLVPKSMEIYRAGNKSEAVDTFLQGTCGPDYRAVVEKALPGAIDQAMANADTFFGHELPALRQWSFGQEEARRITQPVLIVLGEKSGPIHRQRQELLLSWLPNAKAFNLSDAGHLLHVQNPRGMAEGLAAFFARHPFSVK